jgi:hypothetical protein
MCQVRNHYMAHDVLKDVQVFSIEVYGVCPISCNRVYYISKLCYLLYTGGVRERRM